MENLFFILRDHFVTPKRRDVRVWTPNSARGFSFHFVSFPPTLLAAPKITVFAFHLKVKISKNVKFCVWQDSLGRANTLDRVQRHFSLVLYPQWCILCRRHEEDLNRC